MKALIPFIKLFKHQLNWILLGLILSFITILSSIGLLTTAGWFISATAYASLTYAASKQFNYFLPAAGVRFFSLARILSRYGERLVTHNATFKILIDVRLWFYRQLEPLAPGHLTRYQSGDLLTRATNDVDALDNLYLRILSPTIIVILITGVVFLVFSFFSLQIAWITSISLLITAFGVPFITALLAKKCSEQLAQATSCLKTGIIDHVQGLTELKIFHSWQQHTQKLEKYNNDLLYKQKKMNYITGLGSALMTLAMGTLMIAVVWMATQMVASNHLNGAFIAFLALGVMGAFEAVMPLPAAYQYLGKTVNAATRILQVINHKPEVTFTATSSQTLGSYDIVFDHVSFAYQNEAYVLQNLNLKLPFLSKLGIIGPSGSGKTTMIQLLARFWDPQKGQIIIGDRSLPSLTENQLRQTITYFSQQSHIFSASIRENLLIGRDDATDEMLYEALATVNLQYFVQSMPYGLDTWTGEHGSHMSGGQQRRLALARTILKDSPILILDEPTEGLDTLTENKVFKALQTLMQDKTVIMVTHNPKLIKQMDYCLHLPSFELTSTS